MKTYKVFERTSSRTAIIVASSEKGAISVAKTGHNFPLFGFFTVTAL